MRILNFLCTAVLIGSSMAASAEGAASRTAAKSKASASTAKKSGATKRVAAKRKSAGKAVRRSSPRQSQPTVERYIEIQQALIEKGYHSGPATGAWGAEWNASLKRFQADQNLKVDGKLGALSLIALGLGPRREPLSQFAGKPEPEQ